MMKGKPIVPIRFLLLVTAATLLVCGVGCKKSAEKSGRVTFTVAGAPEVITALDGKDYEGAVAAIAAVKAGLGDEPTQEQRQEYSDLLQKVKDVLGAAMSTNEVALKAYQALRFVQSGR
jgi:predicted component of type VI protein secretion system